MPLHLYILTGASRGMGLAMARQLLVPGHTVLTLSRRPSDDLGFRQTRAPFLLLKPTGGLPSALRGLTQSRR